MPSLLELGMPTVAVDGRGAWPATEQTRQGLQAHPGHGAGPGGHAEKEARGLAAMAPLWPIGGPPATVERPRTGGPTDSVAAVTNCREPAPECPGICAYDVAIIETEGV